MQSLRRIGIVMFTCLVFATEAFAATEEQLLKSLPPAERAMANDVDHWGLPFSDQLRRFSSARDAFRKSLGPRAPRNFLVGVQHGLEKVPQNKYWFKGRYAASASLEAARNEHENIQIAVLPDVGKTLKNVALTAGDFHLRGGSGTIFRQQVTIYRVGYVKTMPARYPSLYSGAWPDPLLPNGPMEIAGADLGLFWVDVHVPRDATAGEYQGQLSLRADGESVSIDVSLRVHGFALPDRVPFPIAVWTSPSEPGGKKMSPADYRPTLGVFLAHGVDPVSVGKDFVSLEKNDFAALDENLDYCLARGLQLFDVPSPGDKLERLKPLVEHLRKKGWIQKAILYSNQDEPDEGQLTSQNIPYYQRIKSLYPDLRIYLASEHHPRIDEACDIWMTDLSTGRGIDFAVAHRGRATLWVYYCHLPVRVDFVRPLVQAPNMQIDNEAIEQRLALWLAWKYQTPGMFIYAGNHGWDEKNSDPAVWQKAGWKLSDKPYPFPYAGIHNGNGFLVYPGSIPSVRLKALRDGVEDYGYLMELKKRAAAATKPELKREAEALLSAPPTVLMGSHYFNRDPASLMEVRSKIARLIEALGQ